MKAYLTRGQILERIQALPKKSKYLTREEINQRMNLACELGLFTKSNGSKECSAELSWGAGMPIARSTGCLMGVAGCTVVYRQRDQIIGIGNMVGVPRKAVSAQ